MSKLKIFFFMLIFVLSACSTPDSSSNDSNLEPTPYPEVIENSIIFLSEYLKISPDQIIVISDEVVMWPDACLGINQPDQVCAEVVTPGFIIKLSSNEKEYILHTDEEGKNIMISENAVIDTEANAQENPEAVNKAKEFLANELDVKPTAIKIVDYKAVEWPDGCLGISEPDVMCIQVITPGFQVHLEIDGESFFIRTNNDGTLLKLGPEMNKGTNDM